MRRLSITPEKLSLVLLVIMTVLFLINFAGRVSALGTMQQRMLIEQKSLEMDKVRLQGLLELREQGPLFLERLSLFENLMPEQAAAPQLLCYLQTTASLSGCRLNRVEFAQEKQAGDYLEIPIRLALEGSYYDILALLRNLREGERAIRVDSIRLGGVAPSGERQYLQVELHAVAFFQK